MEMEGKVNNLVRRKKEGEEGFSYVCKLCVFDCVGRKEFMKHLKEEHMTEYNGLLVQLKGDDAEAQLVKLVMKAALVEENNVKKGMANGAQVNGVSKDGKMSLVEEKETRALLIAIEKGEDDRKDYPVSLNVLRMLDARITSLPNYGSLAGRIARLMGILLGKKGGDGKEEKDGDGEEEKDGEGEEEIFHCYKCDEDLTSSIPDIMPHLETRHTDFLTILYTIFPPAKKRMAQFVEKAAASFELRVPTWKEVIAIVDKHKLDKLKELQKEKEALALKKKLEWEEKKKEMDKHKAAMAQKRKIEWEEKKKEMDEAKKKRLDAIVPVSEIERMKQERERVKGELKRGQWPSNGSVRKRRLEKRLEELRTKIQVQATKKINEHLEKRTTPLLENLSPKQLRKLCMNYFGGLSGEHSLAWKDTLESIKMEDEYTFVADFLVLLYDYARSNVKKSFKFGHMLITSNQSELIREKGMRSVRGVLSESWRIPSIWDVENPDEDLGDDWNRKDDSRLLIGAAKLGKNLAKIVGAYPAMKEKVQDEEGKVKKLVKERFAYLLNIYQNRGKYIEEFGLSLYTEDVEEGEDVFVVDDDEDDDDIMEVTIEDEDTVETSTTSTKEETSTATTDEKKDEDNKEEKEESEKAADVEEGADTDADAEDEADEEEEEEDE